MTIEVEHEEIQVSHRYAEVNGCLVQRTGWANYEGASISINGPDVITPVTLELTWEQIEVLRAVLGAGTDFKEASE